MKICLKVEWRNKMQKISDVLCKVLFAKELSVFAEATGHKVADLKSDLHHISDNKQEGLPENVLEALKVLSNYTEEQRILLKKEYMDNKKIILALDKEEGNKS